MTSSAKIPQIPRRWQALLAGAFGLFLISLLYPFQSTTVPDWQVQVVDETGAGVPGISVTEHWQHYLLEGTGHEEARQTDQAGMVEFPARTVRGGLVSRMMDWAIIVMREGAKAKITPYASLVVWGSREHDTAVATYKPGTAPQTKVMVHRR